MGWRRGTRAELLLARAMWAQAEQGHASIEDEVVRLAKDLGVVQLRMDGEAVIALRANGSIVCDAGLGEMIWHLAQSLFVRDLYSAGLPTRRGRRRLAPRVASVVAEWDNGMRHQEVAFLAKACQRVADRARAAEPQTEGPSRS